MHPPRKQFCTRARQGRSRSVDHRRCRDRRINDSSGPEENERTIDAFPLGASAKSTKDPVFRDTIACARFFAFHRDIEWEGGAGAGREGTAALN